MTGAFRSTTLAALAALLVLGTIAMPARGFVLLSRHAEKLRLPDGGESLVLLWDGSAPPKYTDLDSWHGGDYEGASPEEVTRVILDEAAHRWSSVPGSLLRLTIEEDSSASPKSGDGRLVLAIIADDSASSAGGARVVPEEDEDLGYRIADCDITIDPNEQAEKTAFVITHEIGHCLGLGHPHTSADSIMSYARTRRGTPSLSVDDRAALLFLYPDPDLIDGVDPVSGRAETEDLVGGGGGDLAVICGVAGRDDHGSGGLLLLLCPLTWVFYRRWKKCDAISLP
jgi:hypothetical protein